MNGRKKNEKEFKIFHFHYGIEKLHKVNPLVCTRNRNPLLIIKITPFSCGNSSSTNAILIRIAYNSPFEVACRLFGTAKPTPATTIFLLGFGRLWSDRFIDAVVSSGP